MSISTPDGRRELPVIAVRESWLLVARQPFSPFSPSLVLPVTIGGNVLRIQGLHMSGLSCTPLRLELGRWCKRHPQHSLAPKFS